MAKTIVGLFDRREEAETVVKDLVNSGFQRSDISLVANNSNNDWNISNTTATQTDTEKDRNEAAIGAGAGAVIGGITGVLVGIGTFAIPGIGPIVAAGPIATTLAGIGIGAVAGGIIGALVHQGVPEEHAQYYAEGVRRGSTLVTVNSADYMADRAAEIMHNHGAVDIDQRSDQYQREGFAEYNASADNITAEHISSNRDYATTNMNAQDATIPVVQEQLNVDKQPVRTGGVRVYNRMTEEPVEEQVNLRQENVTVDRQPLDRPITEADRNAFQEGTYEVTETSEQPIVNKEARVVEEVNIHKDVQTTQQTIHDTVRRTDVDVENLDQEDLAEDPNLRSDHVTNR